MISENKFFDINNYFSYQGLFFISIMRLISNIYIFLISENTSKILKRRPISILKKVNHVLVRVLLVNLHPLQTTQHIYYWNHICFRANLNWAEIGVLSLLGEYIGWEGAVLNTVKHNLYHIPYRFFNQSFFRIKLIYIYIFDEQNKNWYTITCIFKKRSLLPSKYFFL